MVETIVSVHKVKIKEDKKNSLLELLQSLGKNEEDYSSIVSR